ncbi:MAG: carbon-nitrogen hydrolase family protein [Polyangiaceae bacterium]
MHLWLAQPKLGFESTDQNLEALKRLLEAQPAPEASDILVLPEHFEVSRAADAYLRGMEALAKSLGCYVVGGTQHRELGDRARNTGGAFGPQGQLLFQYEKLRPYADERHWVEPGEALGEGTIAGLHCLVLVCADFWFSDLFQACKKLPSLVLVPALSVSRKPTPDYSRTMWRHLAISRAYEFGCYVGVSDWAVDSRLPRLAPSGVAGFADPTQVDPARLFIPAPGSGDAGLLRVTLDLERLSAFQADRHVRGFFWRTPLG